MEKGDNALATAALLDEIKRVCQAHGVLFVLLDIPSQYNQSNLPRELVSNVADDDIVDLRPIFAKRMKTTPLYWESVGHWTPTGHQIAADALSQRIFPVASAGLTGS